MDGTLLNEKHKMEEYTYNTLRKASDDGMKIIIATGRNYESAMQEMRNYDLCCDYILASGAEVRNQKGEVLKKTPIKKERVADIVRCLRKFPIAASFYTDTGDYRIGTREEVEESILNQIKSFHLEADDDVIRNSEAYRNVLKRTRILGTEEELFELEKPIYKVFIFSEDLDLLARMEKEFSVFDDLASASSFKTNMELTDIGAQKGLALSEYIESLGYHKSEVMVLGDSMNDYSMISMDFGATVAMGNAIEKIKEAASYITKSNVECGVAYAVELARKNELFRIKKEYAL